MNKMIEQVDGYGPKEFEKVSGYDKSASPAGYTVGQRVRITKDIYDYGGDGHHPPGYYAHAGEVLIIREVLKGKIGVSHDHITDSCFNVYDDEFETV